MKSILLHIHGDEGQQSRLEAALALVRATNGTLQCVQVIPLSSYVAAEPFGGMYMMASLYEALEKQTGEDRSRIESDLKTAGIAWTWTKYDADMAHSIIAQSRLADLIVMSRADYTRSDGIKPPPIVADVALHSRTPVLAMPARSTKRFDPDGVAAVAWNGSPEAANALRALVPLLARAAAVHIIAIDGDDGSLPASAAIDYLQLHGITASHHASVSMGDGIGPTIVHRALAFNADYIVMGAYGHSRFREALLGGVTRHMLEECPVPLILAH